MGQRLQGKTVLITGAARGQGTAEAQLFAEEGAQLVVTDVAEDDVGQLEKKLSDAGKTALGLRQDVSSAADWSATVTRTQETFGPIHVLINNAGILSTKGIEETDTELWDKIIAVNQTGVWLGMKHVVPSMREAGGGSIVNLSSVFGIIGSGTSTAYQASKGAVRLLTKTAAVEYASAGIRVNSIHPGVIGTPMVEEELPSAMERQMVETTPLGREGRPEEIAYGALYLASDESSYVTGSELVIDGGYTAQ